MAEKTPGSGRALDAYQLTEWWTDAFASVCFLLGLEDVRQCMQDGEARDDLGHMLMKEVLPFVTLSGENNGEIQVAAACAAMESGAVPVPLLSRLNGLCERWEARFIPMMAQYAQTHDGTLPPCLTLSLAALVMLFAGVRREEDGRYSLLRGEDRVYPEEDEERLAAFSHLSCDMASEALADAALSDRVVWREDLREVAGLSDAVAGAILSLQLSGVRAAMNSAAAQHHSSAWKRVK